MIYIYVKGYNYKKSNGVAVIVDNILKYCSAMNIAIRYVGSLENISHAETIIPYGPKESKELINAGYDTVCCLLVDAISLGYLNKIKHYLNVGHFFHKDFLYSIYAFLRYFFYEKQIVKKYKNIVLVSQADIDYLQGEKDKKKFICLRNGLNVPKIVSEKTKSDLFRIGILSAWDSFQSNEENRWFLKKYVPKYIRNHPNVEFVLAGRGAKIQEYVSIPGVKVVGEVESLDTFFSNIDILLSPNPKGCGILNRVLDAIAYKTPVIGHTGSFSGFKGMEKGFLTFNDYNSFCETVEKIKNKNLQKALVFEACKFAQEYLNWEKNYIEFINQYIKPLVSLGNNSSHSS